LEKIMRGFWRRLSVAALASALCTAGQAAVMPVLAQDPTGVERMPLDAPLAVEMPPSVAPDAAVGGETLAMPPPAGSPPETAGETTLPPPDFVQPSVAITWRVANPFRFFKNASDTEVHRATYLALDAAKRAAPILAAEQALSERHPDGWAATMFEDICWNSSRNRHECGDGTAYVSPESHEVVLKLTGVEDQRVDCTWLTAPLGRTRDRGQSLRQKCSDEATLAIPYPTGARVTVEIGGQEVARTDVVVRDLLVAAMGDSFGSGEGNPDLPVRFSPERTASYGNGDKNPALAGLPARIGDWKRIGDKVFNKEGARWIDTACHRSLYSHQLRAALQLAVEDPHRAVTFVGLSCSGAEVTFGLFLRYKGNEWVPNPPDLSQVSALADAQCGREAADLIDMPEAYHMNGVIPELRGGLVLKKCKREAARKIDLLLVSIGGNDIGFARLVANAVLSDSSTLRQLGGWFGQIHGNMESKALLDRLDERYKALNRAIHGILHVPWSESDRVVLTAYPPLALLGDGRRVCPDGTAGMDVATDFSLSQKRAKAGSDLADQLQRVMAKSARAHGWNFATAHRNAFVGRGICAGFTDNAFSIADDLRVPRMIDGKWNPFAPTQFRAYASRQRWFRTPNDAFMTGNFHAAGSVATRALAFQSLARFQVLLAATYSGAFHPTAEGHAAIADAVVERARAVLKKYGQQSVSAMAP
jgi:lysophospholipase L1-like esterase